MAAAVAMVTGTMVAPGPTSPVTGIIVSSLATRQFSKARGQGVVLMKQGGWSGTAGGRIIIRDTAPFMRPGPQGERQAQALILRVERQGDVLVERADLGFPASLRCEPRVAPCCRARSLQAVLGPAA